MDLPPKSKFIAPAKVNLWLKVLGKRPDGYHELDMLMVKLNLFDEIEVEERDEGIEIQTNVAGLPCDSSNILWKAWFLLQEATRRSFGVKVFLTKKIPVAAGLGGGSSDAAALLQGLNGQFQLGLSPQDLHALGLKLGADVPFFLREGPQWARGVGEILKPVTLPPLYFILMNPQFPVPTAEVYHWYDRGYDEAHSSQLTVKTSNFDERKGTLTCFGVDASHPPLELLENDLEEVVIPRYPVLAQMKELLKGVGALGVLMSGSGPTVFGLFDSLNSRDRGYEVLIQKKNSSWWIGKSESIR